LKNKHSDSPKKFSATDIIKMLDILIDNIFVMYDGRVFQQTVGIHMCTNCDSLLADLLRTFIRTEEKRKEANPIL
jgi:uncharacterized Fe-S cluster-containing MiaB family protein